MKRGEAVVHVIHEHAGKRIEGESSGHDTGSFLLTNGKGYCALCPNGGASKYDGLVQEGWKLVDSLILPGAETVTVVNRLATAERHRHTEARETFRLADDALHYAVSRHDGEAVLDLDMRPLDDESTHGRRYYQHLEGDTLIIRYVQEGRHERYLVVKGVSGYREIGEWQERRYPYDARRGDTSRFWVWRAGAVVVHGDAQLVIAQAPGLEQALDRARHAATQAPEEQDTAVRLEETLALSALDSLTVQDGPRILAGLPWFRQAWSRDELICLGAHIKAERFGLVKQVLSRYYEDLTRPVLRAMPPDHGLSSADALGWLAARTHQLFLALQERGFLDQTFGSLELCLVRDRMATALERLFAERGERGLIVNGPGETWMDAASDGDDRSGARIEIQALTLAAMRLVAWLDEHARQESGWRRRGDEFAARVRAEFFRDGRLMDGVDDGTQRPNIFIAHYVAPELLMDDEWEAAFDAALAALWLDWGGLSSIDTKHPLFQQRYSGKDDRSYHRGDSWYWVNALAGICLSRVDGERWRATIDRLREACLADLLWQGAVGHCSELSSAAEQEWGGCFAQAWSAAMLYELLQEQFV